MEDGGTKVSTSMQPNQAILELSPLRKYCNSNSSLVKDKYKFYLPKTKVELVREQSVELGQVHVRGYMGCHLQKGVIKSEVYFPFYYMHWSSQGRSMDSSFQLM